MSALCAQAILEVLLWWTYQIPRLTPDGSKLSVLPDAGLLLVVLLQLGVIDAGIPVYRNTLEPHWQPSLTSLSDLGVIKLVVQP